MGMMPYALRQELSGGDFSRDSPAQNNPETKGLYNTWTGLSSGGYFSYEAVDAGAHFVQLVRVILQYEDAGSFSIGLNHNPMENLGGQDSYDTPLVEYGSGSFNLVSDLVVIEHVEVDNRIIVDGIDYMLLSDEAVWVETDGVSDDRSAWAEVVGLPINASAGDVGLPFDRR